MAIVASVVAIAVGQLVAWASVEDVLNGMFTHGEPEDPQGPGPTLTLLFGTLGVPALLVVLWRSWSWLLVTPIVTATLIIVPTVWADVT
jgi:hypothetical protein